jgi:hypothetical protein
MKKKRFTKNGIEYWIDGKYFLMGGNKCEPKNEESPESQEERIKHFKDLVDNELENESMLMWETIKSVNAHEYYDYWIKQHQDLEEYEMCAKLLKLKNETPFSDELTHRIIKTGGKLMNK